MWLWNLIGKKNKKRDKRGNCIIPQNTQINKSLGAPEQNSKKKS